MALTLLPPQRLRKAFALASPTRSASSSAAFSACAACSAAFCRASSACSSALCRVWWGSAHSSEKSPQEFRFVMPGLTDFSIALHFTECLVCFRG